MVNVYVNLFTCKGKSLDKNQLLVKNCDSH